MAIIRLTTAAGILACLSGLAVAEDVLVSRRLAKRQLNADGQYNMSFFHINDVHAHLDEFRSSGTDCDDPAKGCYGGYARIKTIVDRLRPTAGDCLFLNAGDEFQGTMYATYWGFNATSQIINQLGFDAMTLGNHEFDRGDDALAAFLENLTFPIISANIQSAHPILNKTILPYHIFEKYSLAVIGVTTETVPSISSPGKDTHFTDVTEAVQSAIDHIRSTTSIKRIVALTHIGYDEDQALAKNTTGLYLIMGGHSHTPLGNFTGAVGPYPTIVENKDGEEVFIVTAYRWGEYLGYIDVLYDADGKILSYRGGPIHADNTTKQDPGLEAQIKQLAEPFAAFAAVVLGQSDVVLDQTTCQRQECLLGDFMADAMLSYRLNGSTSSSSSSTTPASFALINAGGIRATIDAGPVTRGGVLTAFPFGNAIVQITLTGKQVRDVLEGCVSGMNVENGIKVTSFCQISTGIKLEYNPANAVGQRLVRVTVGGEDLDKAKQYGVVTLDFLANGGDNILQPVDSFISLDTQDEVLTMYIQQKSPINIKLDGRIAVVDGAGSSVGSGNGTASGNGTSSGNGTTNGVGSGASGTGAAATLGVAAVSSALVAAVAGALALM